MRLTIAAVNAALRSEGIAAELVRGRGYFYFAGAAFDRAPSTMVIVVRLGQIPTVEGWVREARDLIAKIPPVATDYGIVREAGR